MRTEHSGDIVRPISPHPTTHPKAADNAPRRGLLLAGAVALALGAFCMWAALPELAHTPAVARVLWSVLVGLLLALAWLARMAWRTTAQAERDSARHVETEGMRDRLVAVLEATTDYVSTADVNGRLTYLNAGGRRLLGVPDEEDISQWRIADVHPAWAREIIERETLPAASTKGVWQGETALLTRDGREVPASQVVLAHKSAAGQVRYFSTILRDITERRRAEDALRRAEEASARHAAELERSNRELQDFASIASHDLQEPLRKIMAFGDRLLAHCEDRLDDAGKDCVRRMKNAAERMASLNDALLAYSRVGSRPQALEKVDLTGIVLQVMGDLDRLRQESGGRVLVDVLPLVWADALQMRQLLQNLLGNALKFCRPGTPPEVKISSRRCHNAWEITLSDNGIGFDEKYLDRIFRPFQRLHARSEYEGSGMGLAICQKIVHRHGGDITAHSRPGAGCTFVVTLPAIRKETNLECLNLPRQSKSCLPKTMTMTTS